MDPNNASYNDLIRIPGIGPISAKRIINLQSKKFEFKRREDLKAVGVVLKRAEPYLLINGKNQRTLDNFTQPLQEENSWREIA